jgi:hypothetical protein
MDDAKVTTFEISVEDMSEEGKKAFEKAMTDYLDHFAFEYLITSKVQTADECEAEAMAAAEGGV